jgi:hypothetical protein
VTLLEARGRCKGVKPTDRPSVVGGSSGSGLAVSVALVTEGSLRAKMLAMLRCSFGLVGSNIVHLLTLTEDIVSKWCDQGTYIGSKLSLKTDKKLDRSQTDGTRKE